MPASWCSCQPAALHVTDSEPTRGTRETHCDQQLWLLLLKHTVKQ